jgi:hypothetical protein
MAERFESLHRLSGGACRVAAVEVVLASFLIRGIGLQHLKCDSENLMALTKNPTPCRNDV